jgi:hypothetical protein
MDHRIFAAFNLPVLNVQIAVTFQLIFELGGVAHFDSLLKGTLLLLKQK